MEKILKSKWWKPVFDRGGLELCQKAGWFDDGLNDWTPQNSVQTPIPIPLLKDLKLGKTAVILMTGGFCPLHHGHITAMNLAEHRLINLGFQNVICYFSPGHQDYIIYKKGKEALSESDRFMIIEKRIKQNQNWFLSQYEALQKCSLNYTEVLEWHQWYWKQNGLDAEWFFLAGADNSSFHQVFKDTNVGFIVANRPGSELDPTFIPDWNKTHIVNSNILESSSRLLTNGYVTYNIAEECIIRVKSRMMSLVEYKILDIVSSRFKWTTIQSAEEQNLSISRNNNKNILNLDSLTQIENCQHLEISRLYQPFGYRKICYTNRPGSLNIDEQINKIEGKISTIFDDDIHTGGTMTWVISKLKEQNKLNEYHQTKSYINSSQFENTEIIDLNDFLLNSDSGLVIQINGKECRAPYIWPFVCPTSRASIKDARNFSIQIWQLLSETYERYTVETLGYQLFIILGHSKHDKIKDICLYYKNQLTLKKDE